jgi:ubiquinone biosynthesis protein UbiJ
MDNWTANALVTEMGRANERMPRVVADLTEQVQRLQWAVEELTRQVERLEELRRTGERSDG